MEIMLREIITSNKIPIICVTDCRSLFNELHTSNTIEYKGLRIPIGGLQRNRLVAISHTSHGAFFCYKQFLYIFQ